MALPVIEPKSDHLLGTTETGKVPCWVPKSVQNYIDHTEMGVPIRALARKQGCHASTILRQIRRVEVLRDDPLVDGVIRTLGGTADESGSGSSDVTRMTRDAEKTLPDAAELKGHALRVLRRLCETGAILAVAADMDKGVIVRDGQAGANTRTGVVDRAIAEAMALKGWIATLGSGRIVRYQITAAGRSALADMMARDESAQASSGRPEGAQEAQSDAPRRIRYSMAESPLSALARRRDSAGERFLSDKLVHSGERLREDFEVADMEAEVARDWNGFLEALRTQPMPERALHSCAKLRARARVLEALHELGPGLSDIALRCCCFLEGLETAEKTLGWSARSGKIVLRIALMRLKQHYGAHANSEGAMIG